MKIFSKFFGSDKHKFTALKEKNTSNRRKSSSRSYRGPPHLPRDDFLFGNAVSTSTRRHRRKHRVGLTFFDICCNNYLFHKTS